MLLLLGISVVLFIRPAETHGRLVSPAGRNSMWRYGFSNPPNYDDTALACGGRAHHWEKMNGKCGICGDPFDQRPRAHEHGGKYANGVITGTYKQGQIMRILLQVTANHGGYFEFRICPLGRLSQEATQGCLSRHFLELEDGTNRFVIPLPKKARNYTIPVQLPDKLSCSRCVLQWKWNTGNSWACDSRGKCCIGCGKQEQFINCADIEIKPAVKTFVPNSTMRRKQVVAKPRPVFRPHMKTVVYGGNGRVMKNKPRPRQTNLPRSVGTGIIHSQPRTSTNHNPWQKPTVIASARKQSPLHVPNSQRSKHPNRRREFAPPLSQFQQLSRGIGETGVWNNADQTRLQRVPSTVGSHGALTPDILQQLGNHAPSSMTICRPKYAEHSVNCDRTCRPLNRQLCSSRTQDVRVNVACMLLCEPRN